jgi:hypothetical protein
MQVNYWSRVVKWLGGHVDCGEIYCVGGIQRATYRSQQLLLQVR